MGAYGRSVEGQRRKQEGGGEAESRQSARSVDGKELRGALAQGELVQVVSMVELALIPLTPFSRSQEKGEQPLVSVSAPLAQRF